MLFWLVVAAFAATLVWLAWDLRHKAEERRLAEEARVAAFVSGLGAVVPSSAHKAGEAGEPALAIQLYARLLARYPATSLASPARAALETQKKKLLKA